MALTQAAAFVESKILGHGDNATTEQDITNPGRDRAKYADPSGETMKALVWMGKNTVEVRKFSHFPFNQVSAEKYQGDVPKPRVVEDRDVILKVTGSTVCGSDLHLLHGTVVQLEKGDILGHEFCGEVESMGDAVTGLKKGDRVVASFQIACGDVRTLDYV
jgi:threonine dehydrogenase-like Zn-dependent dehydrogenase